jgi:DNA-binding NarL/FixJ family response regulator
MTFVRGALPERLGEGTFVPGLPSSRRKARTDRKTEALALIDGRSLERECFVRSLRLSRPGLNVEAYASVNDWAASAHGGSPVAILYSVGARNASDEQVSQEIQQLVELAGPTPAIVLAESEDLREMIAAVDSGARGYIPASVGIDVIFEAARLTAVGGIFLPTASALSLRDAVAARAEPAKGLTDLFTPRQASVAHALRRGKANKIIAYELNMCESTVKIHIRNILKKLKATNRTEAAFKLNALCGDL